MSCLSTYQRLQICSSTSKKLGFLQSPKIIAVTKLHTKRWSSFGTRTSRLTLAYELYEPSKYSATIPNPIIFMHGLFGSKKNNRGISKVLARDLGRPVYAIDLRNHGDSPHDPQHNYMAMSEDLAGFISSHSLHEPTLIGHSMGAKTAMTFALRFPSSIRDIVSVDNAPVDATLGDNFTRYIQGMKKIDLVGVNKQSEADLILQDFAESLPVRQFLLGNLHRTDDKKLKFKVPLEILSNELYHMGDFPFKDTSAARFDKPALFVRGTRSKYIPDEALPVIGKLFPRFELKNIDSGHWVISEKPEEFRQAIVEFLNLEQKRCL
ncbi:hypothetical protein K3495_g7435 [Podosphaera aphanis]|nr:hypothetical protein K3495_g7435 [Podosphaera aphanis]